MLKSRLNKMYYKELYIQSNKILIQINQEPFSILKTSVVFGSPFNFCQNDLMLPPSEFGNKVKGHWLRLDFTKDEIKITNDILGGFRLYYSKSNNKIIISDDFSLIIKKGKLPIEKHHIEYAYWLKHRYTTGKGTFIKNLLKINPACTLTINKNINETIYFKDLKHISNKNKHREEIHLDLINTFKSIKKRKKKNILFFSGGKDSCLLLKYLVHLEIPFTPIFFKTEPLTENILSDLNRVRAVSKKLNVKIEEISLSFDKISKENKNEIFKNQIFDRHFSLLHYEGVKKIKKLYGEECLIINGQSSDNILSFGPSEYGVMGFLRRNVLYKPKSFIAYVGLLLLTFKTRKRFKLPKSNTEKLVTLLDDYKYLRVFELSKSKEYYKYLESYIINNLKSINNFASKEMYSKIISYLQGSDNQVVLNSSRQENLEVIMPFATPGIIYSTIMYKDINLEINKPKYVVDAILKEKFLFDYENLEIKKEILESTTKNNKNYLIEMDILFIAKINELFSKKSFKF